MYPLKLKPIYDKTIWGNDKLTRIRGEDIHGYGASWEVSAHPHCQSKITNGEFEGMTLDELLDKYPKETLGTSSKEQFLRMAFLDAKDSLSIQVHPYQAYAIEYDQDNGKTESWYVLDADTNAKLVAGTNVQDAETIRKAIVTNTLEQHLCYHNIVAGDFIHIPSGMLHALGAGILAIEVGTNSNTTYRFYDYGRVDESGKGRELHLEKSFDVVDLTLEAEVIHSPLQSKIEETKILSDNDDYVVELVDIANVKQFHSDGHFNCLCFVSGSGYIEYMGNRVKAEYCDSILIPADCDTYKVYGNCRVLRSYAK